MAPFCEKFNSLSGEHSLQCSELKIKKVTSKKLNKPIFDVIAHAALGSTGTLCPYSVGSIGLIGQRCNKLIGQELLQDVTSYQRSNNIAELGPITQNHFNYNYNYFEISTSITITITPS